MLTMYTAPSSRFEKRDEIKKSLFIGLLFPVHSEEEANALLGDIKKEYKDATHRCFAYRIGTEQIKERSSDDGEPQGTAGHPMLHVLQANGLTNTLGVVVRYFGGIKLGAGGLTRAYSGTLATTVADAPLMVYTPHTRCTLTLPYNFVGAFEKAIENTDIRVEDRTFTEEVTITFLCVTENVTTHEKNFTELTNGRGTFTSDIEVYVPLPQDT